jgi:hypothetical protein
MSIIDTQQLFGSGENATFTYTVKGLNVVSNYLLMDFILIVMFVIVLFILRNFELRDGLLAASTVTWLLSLVLWISDFTEFSRVVVTFCVLIIAVGMTWIKQ